MVVLQQRLGVVEGRPRRAHRLDGKTGALDGSITKLSKDGSIVWSEQYGNPISGKGIFAGLGKENDRFIFDECWGIDSTSDGGAIMACGTGTHCDEFEDNERQFAQCAADPREIWRSLLIKVDRRGNMVWYKTDSFIEENDDWIPNTASEYVLITKDGRIASVLDLDFGFAYTSFTIPFLANVKFVLNPAFDNLHTNDIENPLIDGRPLSSYSFIIFDITESGNDNIHLLKLSWDNQLKWFYQNGTMDYMGRTQGFASTGQFNGYRVYMTQCMPAIWVKDPTKVLKIVMRNPITGGSF